jgi:hypothetical protein
MAKFTALKHPLGHAKDKYLEEMRFSETTQ